MKILINLLPPEKKEELKNLRFIGVIIRFGIATVSAMAVLLIFLFFCLKAITIQKVSLEREVGRFKENDSYKKTREVQDFFREYSKRATKVKKGFKAKNEYWAVINEINSIMPEDINLREFNLKNGNLVLRGMAQSRQSLLVFKDRLEENEFFEKVKSPISNFVANENVDFEFEVKMK